jgi:site-specific DNA-methyltransferase (adenine-specific)
MNEKTSHKIIFGDSRKMGFIKDLSIHLIVCSPPYWRIKDYGNKNQIGFGQSYNNYIKSLNQVWDECYRVLHYSCYLCIVVGNYFTRTKNYGRYKTISIKSDIIKYLEKIGFDLRTEIIWHKISTTNTSGGCSLMGSIYFPRNPIPTQEHEYILIFKKLTPKNKRKLKPKNPKGKDKEKSRIPKEEFFKYMRAYWKIAGKQQNDHKAKFPLEIPKRLIKMYSFWGENVLDCFAGSGTTNKACMKLGRNSYGYEICQNNLQIIKNNLDYQNCKNEYNIQFINEEKG